MAAGKQLLFVPPPGIVRVAACTPRIHVGGPKANAEEMLALMHEGEARSVDLMLFPELGISAYAIGRVRWKSVATRRLESAVGWQRARVAL